MSKLNLTVQALCAEASNFSVAESQHPESTLYGVTDGKKIGTYLEQKFRLYLKENMNFGRAIQPVGLTFQVC